MGSRFIHLIRTDSSARKIDGKWEFAVRCRELNLVLCGYLKGRDGVGGGREVQGGGDMYNYG